MSGFFCTKRKLGERILIGDGIEIVVQEITGKQVKLCVKAVGLKIDRPSKDQDAVDREAWFKRKTE